jgi:two-component system chemotaxis response regulator CheY
MINLSKLKILIVEDQDSVAGLIRKGLRGIGFRQIEHQPSAETALAALHADSFDVVICDYMLGGPTGLDLLDRMRSETDLADVPFIIVTGHGEEPIVRAAAAQRVDGFLLKPVSAEALTERIIKAVRKRIQSEPKPELQWPGFKL